MKTVSITIPIELDHRAVAEARRRGISKSELIRMGLAEVLPQPMAEVDTSSSTADYFRERAGFAQEGHREEPSEVERVVYKLYRRLREALAFDQDFAAAGFIELRP